LMRKDSTTNPITLKRQSEDFKLSSNNSLAKIWASRMKWLKFHPICH
jgi:hypothetical protein